MKNLWKLALIVLISQGVGILGSYFTVSQIPTWYAFLQKPSFSPPNYIFAPVWTTLYFLMGLSLFLVLEEKLKKHRNKIIILFAIQLLLNFTWSFVFFGLHSPVFAFINIAMLWGSIILLIYEFWKYSKPASLLLVPYLLWVSFASILNLFIIVLN
ncbi:MAG: TspO/MBR family protein [Patescibacteria group bacterium]